MRRCFVGWRFAYPTWGPYDLPLNYPLAATETAGFPPFPVGEGRGEGIRTHPLTAARRPMRRCFVGWRFAYPTYGPYDLPLIYSPVLLKLPVLAASTSLRRSRKVGAARMDAG
ncbi:transcriptional regulator (LysR family) [Klebsiella variicola]|nr:transcriptional regulator (LysR family) [Klebsiella variicola]